MYSDSDYEKKVFLEIVNEKPDAAQTQKYNQLKRTIENEMRKSEPDKDYDLILECIDYLNDIDEKYESETTSEKEILDIIEAAHNLKHKKRIKLWSVRPKLLKSILAVILAFTILIVSNCIIYITTGHNIYVNIINISNKRNDANVKNSLRQDVSKADSNQDTYSLYDTLKQKCKQDGLTPILPAEIPTDFELMKFKEQETSINKFASIAIGNKKNVILIDITYYYDLKEIPNIKVSETSNIAPISINGIYFYLNKIDGQYVVTYQIDHYLYTFSSSFGYEQTIEILKTLR